jgi:hypothetical protein
MDIPTCLGELSRSSCVPTVRDEEAAGSNPATPTKKHQLRAGVLPRTLALLWLSGGGPGEDLGIRLQDEPLLSGLQQVVQDGHGRPRAHRPAHVQRPLPHLGERTPLVTMSDEQAQGPAGPLARRDGWRAATFNRVVDRAGVRT